MHFLRVDTIQHSRFHAHSTEDEKKATTPQYQSGRQKKISITINSECRSKHQAGCDRNNHTHTNLNFLSTIYIHRPALSLSLSPFPTQMPRIFLNENEMNGNCYFPCVYLFIRTAMRECKFHIFVM